MLSFKIIKLLVWRTKLTIYGPVGYLGHVTYAIDINFLFLFPRSLYIIFYYDWPSDLREEGV